MWTIAGKNLPDREQAEIDKATFHYLFSSIKTVAFHHHKTFYCYNKSSTQQTFNTETVS